MKSPEFEYYFGDTAFLAKEATTSLQYVSSARGFICPDNSYQPVEAVQEGIGGTECPIDE